MLNRRAVALGLIVLLLCLPMLAQTSDKDLLARIRRDEANNSQIMKTEHMLTTFTVEEPNFASAEALGYFNCPDCGPR